MNQLKHFLIDVFENFQDTPETTQPVVRMSEIANISVTSQEVPVPLYSSTLKLHSEEENPGHFHDNDQMENENKIKNNLKVCDNNNVTNLPKINNNNTNNKSENCTENEKNLSLTMIGPVVNDLKKAPTPLDQKNSMEFTFKIQNQEEISSTESPISPNSGKPKPKVLMGRSALMKTKNHDFKDSLVVHDLVKDKYNSFLNHYYGRMYQRRLSRGSQSTEDGANDSDSTKSLSTIGTPCSYSAEKNDFTFDQMKDRSCFDFCLSTDDMNRESTVEELDDISENSKFLMDKSSDLEYDPKKFLRDALGDEIGYFTQDSSFQENEKRIKKSEKSVDTDNISVLISRAGSFCSSMRKSLRRRCSLSKSNSISLKNNTPKDIGRESKILEDLEKDLAYQTNIILQISKALNYCKSTKEFVSSMEHVEAERILLVACCTKAALVNEINKEEHEEADIRSYGVLEISNLKFPLKENKISNEHRDFTEYFIIILSCGRKVLASDVLIADNEEIQSEKCFKFARIPADFQISVCVYSMIMRNSLKTYSHESKFHLTLENKCPSPRSLFRLHKDSHRQRSKDDVSFIKPSFTSLGKCDITSPDLSRTRIFKMHDTPLRSPLQGTFTANIQSEVFLNNTSRGFLTIGTDNNGCAIWNRRWCVLDGSDLKYWNYPSEEASSPVGVVDLKKCVTQTVNAADRTVCARGRTLLLLIQSNKNVFKKYLLSADNTQEMKNWQNEINYVLLTLRTWNCMNDEE